jgi:hypothetical protein
LSRYGAAAWREIKKKKEEEEKRKKERERGDTLK